VAHGRGEQAALIVDSPVTGSKTQYTYAQLLDAVARCAGALAQRGVETGDRVLIYMPMVAEAVIAMLACARIGACTRWYSADSPATSWRCVSTMRRRSWCCRHPAASSPTASSPTSRSSTTPWSWRTSPSGCIILQRAASPAELQEGRDEDWASVMAEAPLAECVPVAANHPLYILYTSGTTGQPKGVVRDTGGSIVALKWSMRHVYGVQPGEVFWAASDVGWVVGHSYIVYGPLFNGNTTVLYEGKPVGTPDAGPSGA
jgi:propionyl-CoA synthetase